MLAQQVRRVKTPKLIRHPFRWYSHQLDQSPVLTKAWTAATIALLGNALAQKIQHDRDVKSGKGKGKTASNDFKVDWYKAGRFATLNAVLVAPVLHHWYLLVNRMVPGSGLKAVATKVFWDEFVFTPCYLPVFMGAYWSVEGTCPGKISRMIVEEIPSIVMAEWALWVPTMFLTFRLVPGKYQVLGHQRRRRRMANLLELGREPSHGDCAPVAPFRFGIAGGVYGGYHRLSSPPPALRQPLGEATRTRRTPPRSSTKATASSTLSSFFENDCGSERSSLRCGRRRRRGRKHGISLGRGRGKDEPPVA